MTYTDLIGKEFTFKKGQTVPDWMFHNCIFDSNVKIIPKKDRVLCTLSKGNDLNHAVIQSTTGKLERQLCPPLFYQLKK